MPKARSKIARDVDALLAGHSPEGKITIVAAWTESSSAIAPGQKPWRHDLGERPKFVDVTVPHAAMWLNAGTRGDVKAAEAWVKRVPGNGRIFVYPVTEKDPLGRARRDVLSR